MAFWVVRLVNELHKKKVFGFSLIGVVEETPVEIEIDTNNAFVTPMRLRP
jgi:hypothetical protein